MRANGNRLNTVFETFTIHCARELCGYIYNNIVLNAKRFSMKSRYDIQREKERAVGVYKY